MLDLDLLPDGHFLKGERKMERVMERVFEIAKISLVGLMVVILVVGVFVVRVAVRGAVETAEQTIASDLSNEDSALSKAIDASAYRAGAEIVDAFAQGLRHRDSPLANRARGMLRTTVLDFADEVDNPDSVLAAKIGKIMDHYGLRQKAVTVVAKEAPKLEGQKPAEEKKPEEQKVEEKPKPTLPSMQDILKRSKEARARIGK